MSYAASQRRSLRSADLKWLVLALLAHLVLLWLPLNLPRPDLSEVLSLSVSLSRPPEPARPDEEAVMPEPDPTPVTEPTRRDEPPQAIPEVAEPLPEERALPQPEQPEPEPWTPPMTTSELLRRAAELDLDAVPEQESRRLGVHVPSEPPANWKQDLLPEETMFSGTFKPAEVEIVDRWLSPDGTYNVVINTPGGQTLCGRTETWTPVILWRSCGGGGERTFDMQLPERQRPAADPIRR